MRPTHLWRLLAALLLAAGALSTPSHDTIEPPVILAQDDGGEDGADGGNGGDGGAGGDANSGHGNDPDGHDEDNRGQGSGNANDDDSVVLTGGYTVEIDCNYDDNDDQTECDVTTQAEPDAAEIIRLVVPAASVCAEVVDGNFERVDSDADPRLTGFASDEGDDDLSLTLTGEVTTTGTTTYWVASAAGVLPATGPALSCDGRLAADATSATSTPAPETTAMATATAEPPTATAAPTTGSLLVAVLTCAVVPADTTDFDWFGQCQPGGAPQTFELGAAGDETAPSRTAETTDTGEATFDDLQPGVYDLDLVDATWCHAKSDNVTPESDVVIEAGATTTVWIFICEAKTGA